VTVPRTSDIHIRRRMVPLAEVYCSIPENFPIAWTDKTGELSVEMTQAYGVAEVGEFSFLPAPCSLGAGWDSSKKAKAPDSRSAVWRQYPRPDATVGVLTVPLKGY